MLTRKYMRSKIMKSIYKKVPFLRECRRKSDYEEVPNVEPNHEHIERAPIDNKSITTDPVNGIIRIDGLDHLPDGALRDDNRLPKEKWKTFIALLMLIGSFIVSTATLSTVHDYVQDIEPLPDIILNNIKNHDNTTLYISEVMIMVVLYTSIILICLHKHRWIVGRRILFLLACLYLMRAMSFAVTVLPIASRTYYCSPKLNTTSVAVIAKRTIELITGFGLSINGKQNYCGDSIYSGHTVMLVLGYLVINEYSPKRFFLLHWLAWLNAFIGIIMILISHSHYTIDIIIAYYVTTRIFWSYHTLVNADIVSKSPSAIAANYMTREWWFIIFSYFETNVRGSVPRQYDWPLPWPRYSFS